MKIALVAFRLQLFLPRSPLWHTRNEQCFLFGMLIGWTPQKTRRCRKPEKRVLSYWPAC